MLDEAEQPLTARALTLPEMATTWRVPILVKAAFGVVFAMVLAQFVHDAFDVGGVGADVAVDTWLAVIAVYGGAAICFARAIVVSTERWVWVAFGAGIASTATGDAIYGIVYANDPNAPVYSVCDAFWLAWYPLIYLGFGLLLRSRVSKFDLGRWIDGLGLAMIGAAPFAGFVLQPVISKSGVSGLGAIITYSYPVWDMLLGGAAIGLFGILGWRRPAWAILITIALGIEVVADSLYAVQIVDGTYVASSYDYLWTAAIPLIALAAWQEPQAKMVVGEAFGWRTIALPVFCQVVGAALAGYSYFNKLDLHEAGLGLTVGLFLVGVVQMVATRPKLAPD